LRQLTLKYQQYNTLNTYVINTLDQSHKSQTKQQLNLPFVVPPPWP